MKKSQTEHMYNFICHFHSLHVVYILSPCCSFSYFRKSYSVIIKKKQTTFWFSYSFNFIFKYLFINGYWIEALVNDMICKCYTSFQSNNPFHWGNNVNTEHFFLSQCFPLKRLDCQQN